MRGFNRRLATRLALGASALAMAVVPGIAAAQDAGQGQATPDTSSTMGQTGGSHIDRPASTNATVTQSTAVNDGAAVAPEANDVVVTGIRASLRSSINLKRDAQGVVDAISAEDIGKFPDTNLAESLQRITGVSIDRANGEGAFVTVRGFGPDYNLVTLNGRQMPTSTLGDGASAPSSRAFDFANLAAEGIAAVEVYKSGRASVESGGIGATVNIRTPRPLDKEGLRGSLSVKGLVDASQNGSKSVTPEISGIFSDTFADNKVGILVTGSYQKRLAGANSVNAGWRDGYLGSENNWGSLAQPGDPRYANIQNRPKANDVYQVPQNIGYDVVDVNRERINGQAVLQYRPTDTLTATVDYTFSQNTVERRDASVGIWFNHNNTSSAWTNGPVAGPIFYSEAFAANEGKDLAYSDALTANRTQNKSVGGNLTWNAPGGFTLVLDGHHSTAESKPTTPYGTSTSIGTAVFGIQNQTINFNSYIPSFGFTFYPGIDPLNAANIVPTGNAFRNAYFRDEINQGQARGHWDNRGDSLAFLKSVDFGVSYVDNKVRSAYGYIQNDTWGGADPAGQAAGAAKIPDNFFTLQTIPDKFNNVSGINAPGTVSQFYTFNFEQMANTLKQLYNVCGAGGVNASCLAAYTVDRRTTENTIAPYIQFNTGFDLFGKRTHLIGGLRYEKTNVTSSALVPIPTSTAWVSANEFDVGYSTTNSFTTFKGSYDNYLPSVDFDIEPMRNVKLRASYSHTIARATYDNLQGGRTIDQLFRIGNGTGSQGNPGLIPLKSRNVDLSAEWYYKPDSYISIGFFNKDVSNFIGVGRITTPVNGLTNPGSGPRYRAAIAALGANASTTDIRQYIFKNFPTTTIQTGVDPATGLISGSILGQPNDDPLQFQISTPTNSAQTANIHGFEFAISHTFWNTGFGTILNYTLVDGDAKYNNALPASAPAQFALTGLSDSANAVLFYDKGKLQGRVAYNWRGQFLNTSGPNPTYVESYGQVDGNVSYQLTKGVSVLVEVINLTGSNQRQHLRSDRNVNFVAPGDARYYAGFRFAF